MEEKVSLKRNEIFIAHNKCVYAGGEVSENNVRVLGSLEDKVQNTKKNIKHIKKIIKNIEKIIKISRKS